MGASFIAVKLIVKVTGSESLAFGLVEEPLSRAMIVITLDPFAFAAVVKLSFPSDATAGGTLINAAFELLVTTKLTV
jgi:hypothetical protein